MEKLIRHGSEIARPLEELRPDVPRTIAEIVRKLMAKKPAERFQTPDELMDALSPHAAPSVMDWPIAPRPDEAPDRSTEEQILVDTEPKATE